MPKSPDVETWLENYDNPMKPVLLRVREIMLEADPRLGEAIKWAAPTFVYNGNLATFNPRAKRHASLVFHTGGILPLDGLVDWRGDGTLCRTMTFAELAESEAKRGQLVQIVQAWIMARG